MLLWTYWMKHKKNLHVTVQKLPLFQKKKKTHLSSLSCIIQCNFLINSALWKLSPPKASLSYSAILRRGCTILIPLKGVWDCNLMLTFLVVNLLKTVGLGCSEVLGSVYSRLQRIYWQVEQTEINRIFTSIWIRLLSAVVKINCHKYPVYICANRDKVTLLHYFKKKWWNSSEIRELCREKQNPLARIHKYLTSRLALSVGKHLLVPYGVLFQVLYALRKSSGAAIGRVEEIENVYACVALWISPP